jgi:hypothetical protein
MELADQQVSETEGLSGAEIPASAPTGGSAGEGEPASKGAASPDKPEKLSLRQQIEKNVEAVRTEEAKRARAADGKFTKLDGAAEKPATDKQVSPTEQEAQPEPAKAVGPPPGWSAESKAFFNSLPPDHPIRRDVAKREEEVSSGFKQYSDKAKQYDAIEQVIAPVRQTFQQAGISSDADAIKALLGWEAGFRNPATRVQSFQNLARQYGVDISTLVPSSSSAAPSAAQDIPEPLRPVIDQFGNVVQQVQSVEARLQSWEQQQIAEKLTSFASSHPHFEAVRVQMGQLMNAGIVQPGDLETAYQKAIALNPEISARIREAEDRKKADELAKANAAKVEAARRAAVSPTPRPPMGAPGGQPAKKAGVRESILASVQQLREEQRA